MKETVPATAFLWAVLGGLAAFRASRLLARDALLDGIRHRFYRRFPPDDYYRGFYRVGRGKVWQLDAAPKRPRSWLGTLVDCPWCSSVWFSAAIVAAAAALYDVPAPVLVWAAACSVAGICATIGPA